MRPEGGDHVSHVWGTTEGELPNASWRRGTCLGLDDTPVKAIISADVLVVSHTVTENLKTVLRIRAVHGPTGELLGELKAPIDPAHPAVFDPPLERTVRDWWPIVLGRLRDSREKPSWVVLDVYYPSLDAQSGAHALRETLQESLAAEETLTGEAEGLASAARTWLRRQIAANPRRPVAARVTADVDDWARQQDRSGFIDLLTKMQQRWPDPKHPQWAQTIGPVDGMVFSLFRNVSSDNSSFQLWHRGLRGIGDIPKAGYKPQDDQPRYCSMLEFAFAPEATKVKDAFRLCGAAYRKVQPAVDVPLTNSGTYLDAAEAGHQLTVVVGPISADDLKALKELYRGGELPLRRIGYLHLADGTSEEVSVLLPPGAGKNEVLDDFLRFLDTPQGRDVLAGQGIYASAGKPWAASQPTGERRDQDWFDRAQKE
jgi:hypothetical protein